MLAGVGVDIIEVPRINLAIRRWGDRFLKRVFTTAERDYCMRKAFPEQSLAARFAAKEAVLKAMGTGLSSGIGWTEVEIVNRESGKPEVKLGKKTLERIGSKRILISISHTKGFAIASAILLEGPD
ncbi:MAG: holo-ACP synthase [Candidatus Zixiibacteriota bacterium]